MNSSLADAEEEGRPVQRARSCLPAGVGSARKPGGSPGGRERRRDREQG